MSSIDNILKQHYKTSLAELQAKQKGIFDPEDNKGIRDFIKNATALKPGDLFIPSVGWKLLVRSGLRGKNIMLTGHQGSGKTKCARALGEALGRKMHYFNIGAMQDPRISLIGNTTSHSGTTEFVPSRFARAIQEPFAVILCDELSRGDLEAWNILMTVFDPEQRYLALDEGVENTDGIDDSVIKVAPGVTFIATANIGRQFTATKVMDEALEDRFVWFEMPLLNASQETELLLLNYPEVHSSVLEAIGEIADFTRLNSADEENEMDTIISTRNSLEWAGLINDGFSFLDSANVAVTPRFRKEGGLESERAQLKQKIQQYGDMITDENEDVGDDLFDLNEDF